MSKDVMKTIQTICRKNVVIIFMIVLLCPILAVSYSSFIINTEKYRASQMYIGNLLYSMKINGSTVNTLVVEPGETEATIEVTSLNTVSSNYKVVYEINPNVNVIYAVDENEPTYGFITSTKTSSILVTNNSEENITLTFNIAGGFTKNDVSSILVDNGYTEINDNYMKYDYETLALFVDNVRVERLDPEKAYNLLSYTCANGEEVKWYNNDHALYVVNANNPTKCQLYFEETVWDVYTSYSCANTSLGSEPYTLTYTGNCEVTHENLTDWKIKFLTSGSLVSQQNLLIDAFVVGGGGGGGVSSSNYTGGGGGGSGYVETYYGLTINKGVEKNVVIGQGGASTKAGGMSYILSNVYYANGGYPGSGIIGGSGGSGGGGGGYSNDFIAGAGGSNGEDGTNGSGTCGSGTQKSSYSFGIISSSNLFAAGGSGGAGRSGNGIYGPSVAGGIGGGGNGGSGSAGASGTENTGSGGGGGSYPGFAGGSGGSGLVIIKNHADVIYRNQLVAYYTGDFEVVEETNSWKIKFLTSGIFTPLQNMTVDAFVVGGGGGGSSNSSDYFGGGGGGGGYANTYTGFSLTNETRYTVVVGAGGQSSTIGEQSYFISETYKSNGGNPGSGASGGMGGSGGGGGGHSYDFIAGAGGSNGENGLSCSASSGANGFGGNGSGTTTYEFGEFGSALYSSGGGGGSGRSGNGVYGPSVTGGSGGGAGGSGSKGRPGTKNTGGGGGGGSYPGFAGGAGGSGIVILRISN